MREGEREKRREIDRKTYSSWDNFTDEQERPFIDFMYNVSYFS